MADKRPEILAPAGSREALEAAVRCGADAVYLGVKEFNARRGAENFELSDLPDTVAYCHIRGVKCYLTLNILLRREELDRAAEVVRQAAAAGIDAVIVQDLGLARLLHGRFPGLPLHASTQCSALSPAALPFLKQLGFKQVVAAREMDRATLAAFCAEAERLNMTVEIFVHGALCMSVSGQCLLSAVLGGRSGNRGLCAGPCRLPFSVSGGTGHDLSLKDLSLLNHFPELAEMGIASFKIEGRMKRPEYVAAGVAACRAMLDTGSVPEGLSRALQNVFLRSGLTDGYYTGRTGPHMFGVRSPEDAAAAAAVYPEIHALYRAERQTVPVTLHVEILPNERARMTASDGRFSATVEGPRTEPAGTRALDRETVLRAIGKLGGTPYSLGQVDLTLQDGLYLPTSAVKTLRREALEALSAMRAAVDCPEETDYSPEWPDRPRPDRPRLIARFAEEAQIPEELSGIAALLLPPECDPPAGLPERIPLIADLPRGFFDEKALPELLKKRKAEGWKAAYCGTPTAVTLARRSGLAVVGGIGLNVLNETAAAVLSDMGAAAVTLSPELRLAAAAGMPAPLPLGIFAYGRLPLMLTRNCPAANGRTCASCDRKPVLTDRKRTDFPVRCRSGFSEVLNSCPILLCDRLDDAVGLDFLLLWFTDESREEAARVLRNYRFGAPAPKDGFTRGLYYKTEP